MSVSITWTCDACGKSKTSKKKIDRGDGRIEDDNALWPPGQWAWHDGKTLCGICNKKWWTGYFKTHPHAVLMA